MPSTSLSTSCRINAKPYDLRICVDEDPSNVSATTIDEIASLIDNWKPTPNQKHVLDSIQLRFQSLASNEETSVADVVGDTVPEMISLQKLVSIKLTDSSADESISSSIKQRLVTMASSDDNKALSPDLPQVDVSYMDVSEAFLWTVNRLHLEMNSEFARQLCSISNRYLSKLPNRPRHLLVFVNPKCGKGKPLKRSIDAIHGLF
jgi:hypothetical protein